MAHAGPGQAGLVGEEATLLVLDDLEAQAQAGAEDDPCGGAEAERSVEAGAFDLGVPPRPCIGIGIGAIPHPGRTEIGLQMTLRLPAAQR